ncbi:MAG: twin-arginine translocase TatA/TatE family subunit [Dehalococcoidia bacterium]
MRVGGLGAPELILIALALVLVFGAGTVGEVGGALGKSVRDFRKAMHEQDDEPEEPQVTDPLVRAAPSAASAPLIPEYRPARATAEPQTACAPSPAADDGPGGTMPAA